MTEAEKSIYFMTMIVNHTPVSYTHLDVYKRQAKGINRAINLGNVEKILAMMKVKGYRKAEMVQVVKAEDVLSLIHI